MIKLISHTIEQDQALSLKLIATFEFSIEQMQDFSTLLKKEDRELLVGREVLEELQKALQP